MDIEKESPSLSLGQYLEQGRQRAGLTLRQLAEASGVNVSAVNRLLKDEVEHPAAEHLQSIANVLELDMTDALGFIGVTPPKGLPGISPYLRAKHKFRGETLNKAAQEIQNIINKYDGIPSDE